MKRKVVLLGLLIALSAGSVLAYKGLLPGVTQDVNKPIVERVTEKVIDTKNSIEDSLTKESPTFHKINLPQHYFQTFNNCGPATLSMILNFYNINVTQQTIGNKLRPYQNPQGDNDDKSTTLEELAREAEARGFRAYYRPNGTIEKLKALTSNDIPVVVKTWLELTDDIGHYRIVTGFNDESGYIIQDDSYQGRDRRYSYELFNEIWQPFNYQYLIIVPVDRVGVVEEILDEEISETRSYQLALARAESETASQPGNAYPVFNQAASQYHLGNYNDTISLFERVENQLPRRMLWYELEPIEAYIKTGAYDEALQRIEAILNGGNRAYSELYLLRGGVYLEQGKTDLARGDFEKAVLYNENMEAAKVALENVQ